METSPLRVGILGTGGIARAYATSLQSSDAGQVVAIASRTQASATQFAEEFSLANAHEGYDALLRDPSVDAVYNALPNSMHAEWTIKAAQAGKHVLCEKPLAVSLTEARKIYAAAEEYDIIMLEAFPYAFQPQTLKTVELIRNGTIGAVQLLQAAFGFTVARDEDVRLNASLAGGALMDVGCYPVSFARMVLGECPNRVSAVARWTESGVDLSLTGTLEYPSGAVAQIACSLATGVFRQATVLGSNGVIETDYFNHSSSSDIGLRLKQGTGFATQFENVNFEPGDGFVFETRALAQQAQQRDEVFLNEMKQRSLDNAATLEALLRSAREGIKVDVDRR